MSEGELIFQIVVCAIVWKLASVGWDMLVRWCPPDPRDRSWPRWQDRVTQARVERLARERRIRREQREARRA